ncbi:MAG: hypothetical protein IKR31_05745 [Prevotella sp.]|nr:hypothetical protein [Prevotella sp.]
MTQTTNNMTTQNLWHAASRMRLAEIAATTALRGRLFLTLLMMLLTATTAWADCVNVVDIPDDSEQSNDGIHSTESDNATSIDGINASDVTSSFDRLKVIYKKVGNNESQAFGVWQQLSESERTAAFAHTQRLQGDLSLRSYLYVYLRDKEWMKAM